MSLPISWVDRIFDKLTLTYGRDFTGRWIGTEPADVKADWAQELSGFVNWPEAIKFGLENLPPDRAPTVLQFREICRRAPPRPAPALPEPIADPARVKREIERLAATVSAAPVDPKAWAQKIIARHDAGERVSPTVLRSAEQALKRTRSYTYESEEPAKHHE